MKKAKGRGKSKAKSKSRTKAKSRTTTESKTKSSGKGSGTAKKAAEESAPRTKEHVDIVKVRENITNLVGASAEVIATEVINVAKAGQLAPAKYLFEMIGLYPATEETTAKPQEDSLAHVLLRRMRVPTEPGVGVKEPASLVLAGDSGVGAGGGEEQGLNAEAAEKKNAESAESTQVECRQAGEKGGSSQKDTVE
jgi:hypothetical protein